MKWLKKRQPPSRVELVERKHQLEGQINVLSAELRRLNARREPVGDLEARLAQLRSRHYQTRLLIDRTKR